MTGGGPLVVLAYSGLTGSWPIRWLVDAHGADVVTLTLDVGDGRDLEPVRDRALAWGATRAHVLDVREELAGAHVLPALRAGETLDGVGRPVVVRTLVELAAMEHAGTVAHGSRRAIEGREAVDGLLRATAPDLRTIVVPRAGGATEPAVPRGESRGTPRPAGAEVSVQVELRFDQGVPTAVNRVPMDLVELLDCLSTIAGRRGTRALEAAYRALGPLDATTTGTVRLLIEAGACAVIEVRRAG